MTTAKTCADCSHLISEDGQPVYCAMKDLYTFVDPDDPACEDFD